MAESVIHFIIGKKVKPPLKLVACCSHGREGGGDLLVHMSMVTSCAWGGLRRGLVEVGLSTLLPLWLGLVAGSCSGVDTVMPPLLFYLF